MLTLWLAAYPVRGAKEGGRHPINSGAVDWFRVSPRFSSSMPLPNRPLQQSAQEFVKSAPKRKGPGGRLSPRDLAVPARFFEGFAKSRPPRTMTRKAQASSAQPAATKVLAWSYGRSLLAELSGFDAIERSRTRHPVAAFLEEAKEHGSNS
jgi:hypothetical protein